jgi:hypothetical protein
MGVDKNFAHQARKLGRLDQQDFDDLFDDWRNLKPYSSAADASSKRSDERFQ